MQPRGGKGLCQFLDAEQQRSWLEGIALPDAEERTERLEQRFKYLGRFEKFLRRPQSEEVLSILRVYAERCIPVPRRTERHYWSVSCLPSTSDRPLVRVNASWMELFTLYAEGDDIRARFIVHLSDFTIDRSTVREQMDDEFLHQCLETPIVVSFSGSGADLVVMTIRGPAPIRQFLADARALRGIRNFNLTHMNRGRNAYQASHCYSVADHMLGD